ncbi:MAG: AraC family transcriptional regulator [Dorea sp.]|uniref:helix-turn-helix transcriptional regulator n=1 Tax=Sporofaciens musculi TaxID=2681861 RepID=UPI00216BAE5F|nr:AraC family transcriptional regulator [Sporofaciens musculi]MCI9422270.1 AraC family transcriptional regulator [Dorea sp.]
MQLLSPTLKEISLHGTKSFPCAIYHTRSTGKGTLVKHHWHDEVEILYFSDGEFRLEINMEQYFVPSEALYFINPGELHSIYTEKTSDSGEDAIVFSLDTLSFDSYDAAQMQLIQPIQNGKMLFPRCLLPDHPGFLSVRNAFLETMHSFGHTPSKETFLENGVVTDDLTNQLFIKSSLLRILAILSRYQLFTPTEKNLDKRVEGIKTVLTYIRENYKEKIYIQDLAAQVHMNEQYFCRFFKKSIGRSPMEYLNEYRIKQAMRLLKETDLPVMEVCLECGYNNLGNFLRAFKKHTETTPLKYRNHSHEDGKSF